MPSHPTPPRSQGLALVAILVVYALLSLVLFDQIEEDALIYLRLAANVADGFGYVFNRGGEPIEAGSSALWMLLLVVLAKLPWDLLLTAKLAGIAVGGCALVLVYRLSRPLIADPVLRLAPVAITAGSVPFLMWSQRGMETPLYTLVVVWLVYTCIDRERFRHWALPAIALLLARPEAFLILLALVPAFALYRPSLGEVGRSLAWVAGFTALMLVVRFAYFDDLVPHPFYTKLRFSGGFHLDRPFGYLWGSHFWLFALPALLVAWRRDFWEPQRVVVAGFAALLALWSALANEPQPYYRHMVPAIPVLCVLVVSALEQVTRRHVWARLPMAYAVCLLFLAAGSLWSTSERTRLRRIEEPNPTREALAAFAAAPVRYAQSIAALFRAPETMGVSYQSLVGDFVRLNYRADAVVVFDQMGKAPYRAGTDTTFIDALGLTDRTIGHFYFATHVGRSPLARLVCRVLNRSGELTCDGTSARELKRDVLDYVFEQKPDVILLNDYYLELFPGALPGQIRSDRRFERGYQAKFLLGDLVRVYERRGARTEPPRVPDGLAFETL